MAVTLADRGLQLVRRQIALNIAILRGFFRCLLEHGVTENHLPHSPQVLFDIQRRRRHVFQIVGRSRLLGGDDGGRPIPVGLQLREYHEDGGY